MLSSGTSRQLHKLVPIPSFFFATRPVFFDVMKNRSSNVIIADVFCLVFFFRKFFQTTFISASHFSTFSYENFFLFFLSLFLVLFLFFFDFFVKVTNFFEFGLTFWKIFNSFFGSVYSVWLVKSILVCQIFLFFVTMFSSLTALDFLEFIPTVDYFVTTSPSFFQVVKHRLAWMILTGIFFVFWVEKLLKTASVFAL